MSSALWRAITPRSLLEDERDAVAALDLRAADELHTTARGHLEGQMRFPQRQWPTPRGGLGEHLLQRVDGVGKVFTQGAQRHAPQPHLGIPVTEQAHGVAL